LLGLIVNPSNHKAISEDIEHRILEGRQQFERQVEKRLREERGSSAVAQPTPIATTDSDPEESTRSKLRCSLIVLLPVLVVVAAAVAIGVVVSAKGEEGGQIPSSPTETEAPTTSRTIIPIKVNLLSILEPVLANDDHNMLHGTGCYWNIRLINSSGEMDWD
jgi:hypothetical protein